MYLSDIYLIDTFANPSTAKTRAQKPLETMLKQHVCSILPTSSDHKLPRNRRHAPGVYSRMTKFKEISMRRIPLTCCAVLLSAASLHAQSFTTKPCPASEESGNHWFSGSSQACEARSTTFPLVGGHLNVNSQNGAIDVIGEDRQDVALEARVTVHAGSQSEAQSLLHEIKVDTGATVEALGPRSSGQRNWSVSYHLHVPHHLAANFHTENGALTLAGLEGSIQGDTTNGGLRIDNLAGDVHVRTNNGGIHANLNGPTWRGTGLVASTTNGGVSVSVPSNYSAHLVASTVNGGTSLNVPGAPQTGVGRHSIDTNLGSGGPTVSFETVNGGVSIQ
jgi:hypothetical protein